MVTGASTADVAVILVDASQGVLTQTRRHSFLTSLLGIPNVVLAINKMDLVDFDQEVFDQIEAEYRAFADALTFKYYRYPAVSVTGRQCDRKVEPHDLVLGPDAVGILGNR